MVFKRIGKDPSGERQEKISKAQNYNHGKFYNVEPTSVNPENVSFFRIIKEFISRPKTVTPSKELPHKKVDLFKIKSDIPAVVWFGHSSYFLIHKGFKILVDPVFSGNASPVKFFGKSFKGTDIYSAQDFPEIDLLLLTHDHYDHLDYQFLKKITTKVHRVVTSLGVGEHLEAWGFGKEKIHELNWGEKQHLNDSLEVTALPSRHFSGRGFKRFNTLWSSFLLQWDGYKIYVGGDSGYSSEYKRIGEEYGQVDIAFLECGQYGKYWPQIHMTPEETVQAAKDLKAKILFPVHWGKFVLSVHPWNEPIRRLSAEAEKRGQRVVAPLIGELYTIDDPYIQQDWWNFEEKA